MAKAGDAVHKFPCAKCGADVEYVPRVGMKCPFCGHEQGEPRSPDQVVEEIDFEAYVARGAKGLADAAPSGEAATRELKCDGCGARSAVASEAMGLPCPFCGKPLVMAPPSPDVLRPEGVVPFAVTKDHVVEKFRSWVRSRWFAPNALKRLARSEGVQGVYRPFWTFDAATHSFYEGERGEHYHVTEEYRDSQGKRQTRQVRKTRWHPASGQVEKMFDDVVVSAGKQLDWDTAFGLEAMKPYDPGFLAGWIAERYSVEVKDAWPAARKIMDGVIASLVRSDIGGDEQRVAWIKSSFDAVRFKHVLLPLYLASYTYGGKAYRFQANGQTGEIHGERPYSVLKILFFILSLLLGGGLVLVMLSQS